MVILQNGNQTVKIDKGELVGYQVDGHEVIHQKGSPGWRSSDTEMFPIIGPTSEAHFQVQTPRDIAIMDQHGILRELDYELESSSALSAVFKNEYKERSPVRNSKFPEKSNKQFLFYTYGFLFKKQFLLTEAGLEISFVVSGERDMPFMLGYHPAFKLYSENPTILSGNREISLKEVLAVGSRAYKVPDCEKIVLKDAKEVTIETEGFQNFMLWTEVENMICLEPITFYPYDVEQRNLNDGFQFLGNEDQVFKVKISVS